MRKPLSILLILVGSRQSGQICLLPPSSLINVVSEISHDYPGAYLACERSLDLPSLEWFGWKRRKSERLPWKSDFDWDRPALIAFTSGSTGKAQALRP